MFYFWRLTQRKEPTSNQRVPNKCGEASGWRTRSLEGPLSEACFLHPAPRLWPALRSGLTFQHHMAQRGSKGHTEACQAAWHSLPPPGRTAPGTGSQLQPGSGRGRPGWLQDAGSARSRGSGHGAVVSAIIPKRITQCACCQTSSTAEETRRPSAPPPHQRHPRSRPSTARRTSRAPRAPRPLRDASGQRGAEQDEKDEQERVRRRARPRRAFFSVGLGFTIRDVFLLLGCEAPLARSNFLNCYTSYAVNSEPFLCLCQGSSLGDETMFTL